MPAEDKKHKKESVEPCEVCRANRFDNQIFQKLVCRDCKKTVHRYCYAPDTKEKNKFRCDECKKKGSQKKTESCSLCGKSNGILKDVGMGEWMHILCALTSARTKFSSYKSLNFSVQSANNRKIKVPGNKRCRYCNFNHNEGLHCWVQGCKNCMHMDCVISYQIQEQPDVYPPFLTIGLLDRHENSLLCNLSNDLESFKGLALLESVPHEVRYLVCNQHNSELFFVWCPCNKKNQEIEYKDCDRCKRWFHSNCTKFKKYDESTEVCLACEENDIYKRNLKLPELIYRIQEIEGSTQLDKPSVKFLDHFSLKLSQNLHKILFDKKNVFQIERYYLRKALESNVSIVERNQQVSEGVNIVEIMYYLLRREVKKEGDISFQELSKICEQLTNKNSKFDWGQEKNEKIEKKYSKYLQSKLRQIQRDDSRAIKPKLKEFARRNQEMQRSHHSIAVEVQEIVGMLKHCQVWKPIYQKYIDQSGWMDSKQLLQLFYHCDFDRQSLVQILGNLSLILRCGKMRIINQSDYNRIVFLSLQRLSAEKAIKIKGIYKNLLTGIKIHRLYDEKRQLLKDLQNRYTESKNVNEKRSVNDSLLKNNILVPSNSILLKIQTDLLEFTITKKKYMKNQKQPTASHLEQSIKLINSLLVINQRVGKLTSQELSGLIQAKVKYIFYANILHYHNKLKSIATVIRKVQSQGMQVELPNSSSPEEQQNGEKGHAFEQNHKSISQTVTEIIEDWVFSNLQSVLFAVNQIFELAKYEVRFEEGELDVLYRFIEVILSNVLKRVYESGAKIKGQLLSKVGKIVVYANLQDYNLEFMQLYREYQQWKEQLEHRFINIEQILEDGRIVSQLLNVIQNRKIKAEQLDVDVTCQLRKLQILKIWAILSRKILSFQKISIYAVQNLKMYMDRVSYPKNKLRDRIEKLQVQSRNLNKQISKFLQKPKMADMEIYEELNFIKGKMTLQEAESLRKDLEQSELYVQIQLQSLVEYIKEFKGLPKEISDQFCRSASLEECVALQKRILHSPFMYGSIDQYYLLLLSIYRKKCTQYQIENEDIGKKQYFRLLHYGGPKAAEFYSQTFQLHKAYRDVEVAERQLLSGSAKVKYENLLPNDGRKLKIQLKDDPVEGGRVDRWYMASQRLREKFRVLRASRGEFEKYLLLEGQLLRLPINNRQILNEIGKIKRQIEDLTLKVKRYMAEATNQGSSTLQFENPYTSDIVQKYRYIGARTEYMDRFEFIFLKNKEIMQLGRNISIENYRQFSRSCSQVAELMNNNQVYRMREVAFQKMWKIYVDSAEPLMEIGWTLLAEGGALCRYPNKSAEVLSLMMEVNNKFYRWSENRIEKKEEQEEEDISQPEEEEESDSNNYQQQFDSQLNGLDDDQDEDESSSAAGKRGSKNEVVQLDD